MSKTIAPVSASAEAGADLSASQYCFVKINSSGQLAVASDGGADAVGVLQDAPAAAGRVARYDHQGVTRVKAGGTLAAGADFSCDAAGKAVAVGTGESRLGVTREAAVNGQIISVVLDKRGL